MKVSQLKHLTDSLLQKENYISYFCLKMRNIAIKYVKRFTLQYVSIESSKMLHFSAIPYIF